MSALIRYIVIAIAIAIAIAVAVPRVARAQMTTDGHRGVCSDCHLRAARVNYELNTAESILVFALDAFGFSKTVGTFDEIVGSFVFDPGDAENASVIVSVDLRSLEMSDSALNSLVLSERFLDADNNALMTFQSEAVEPVDATHLRVDGTVSLRGIERPMSLAVVLNKLAAHPLTGKQTAGLVVTGLIKRSDFGITLGLPSVGDQIEFTVYAQGSLLD